MYARLYTTDSTQVLLPKESDGDDDMLDKNGDLNFYGSKGNPKKSSSNNYWPKKIICEKSNGWE
jgi:hypothetical protein